MGCCQGRIEGGFIAEQCLETEKRIGLQDITILKFREMLQLVVSED